MDTDARPGGPGNRRARVTIIQPYVPSYRVPFFDELARLLGDSDIALSVAHGEPSGAQAARADSRLGAWSVPIRVRELRWGRHRLHYRRVPTAKDSDVVVAELASTNLDTYLMALFRRRQLMLWGHGKAYVTDSSRLDGRLELWLARRAQRVFVYTKGGADHLRAKGCDPARITVVCNSTDTVALRNAAALVSDERVRELRTELDLGAGSVVCFVGSYDDSKLLPLLLDAVVLAHEQMPELRLLVAGAGPLQHLVDNAASTSTFVRSLPRTDTAALALVGRLSTCMVMPGRIGLVAVDALALGLPIVTTTYAYHAPEAEYLTDDVRIVGGDSAETLAHALTAFLGDEVTVARARRAATALGDGLTVEAMAKTFADELRAYVLQAR